MDRQRAALALVAAILALRLVLVNVTSVTEVMSLAPTILALLALRIARAVCAVTLAQMGAMLKPAMERSTMGSPIMESTKAKLALKQECEERYVLGSVAGETNAAKF